MDREEIDNLLVPYSEEEELDPLRRSELSEEEKNLFKTPSPETEDVDEFNDEPSVTFDETQNTTKFIPSRNETNDFAEEEEPNTASASPATEETTSNDVVLPEPGRRSKRNLTKHDYAKMHQKGVSLIFSYLCENYK